MSSIESYDGLCGIIHLNSSSDQRVRCHFEFGHSGPHSWENKKVGLSITGGTFYSGTWKTESLHLPNDNKRKRVVIGTPDDLSEE